MTQVEKVKLKRRRTIELHFISTAITITSVTVGDLSGEKKKVPRNSFVFSQVRHLPFGVADSERFGGKNHSGHRIIGRIFTFSASRPRGSKMDKLTQIIVLIFVS